METLALLWDNAEPILAAAGAVVIAASAITATTTTPDPDTKLGKLYKVIELIAFVTEKVKQHGRRK